MPTMAMWIFGSVVTSRAFPSLVTSTRLPVSATRDVGAGDAHVGAEKLGAQLIAGHLHQARDVGREPLAHLLAEDLGHLLLGHVDGRHHHVRGPLPSELDDPLAQVGLTHRDTRLLQVPVQVDLLGGHRLRFDDDLRALFAGHVQDVFADLLRIVGAVDLGARASGRDGEVLGQQVEMSCGIGLQPGDTGPQRLEIDAFVGLGAADAVGLGEPAERSRKVRVLQCPVDRGSKLLCSCCTLVHEHDDQALRPVHADG